MPEARLFDIQANSEISVRTEIRGGQYQKGQLKPFFATLCFSIHYLAMLKQGSTVWTHGGFI
jgi:hypothetical protein